MALAATVAFGLFGPSVRPAAAAGPAGADPTTTAEEFVPAFAHGAANPTARERENARAIGGIHPVSPASRAQDASAGQPDASAETIPATSPRLSTAAVDPLEGVSSMSWFSVVPPDEFGVNATTAVLATRMLTGTTNALWYQRTPTASTIDYTGAAGFFNLPNGEYYWPTKVYASLYKNRFIAVMPSFDSQSKDCLRGHLNIAVSRTSDPMKSWYRFRVTQTDAWTDEINVGFSDNKVVLTVNEWDLSTSKSDCAGTAYEGARIKVADWSDLLDGGSLTVRDVSPTGRTNYFGWMPIVTVPGTSSTSAGSTVRLVGERKTTTWGDVAYATVTGSAVSGTAKLASNVNLTSARGLAKLFLPPASIQALPGSNPLDERITSATARGSRLFFTSNQSCKTDLDTVPHACVRAVELNTSTTTPTVVEYAEFLETDMDTFIPFTGLARDGTVFFVMSRSSALAPEASDVYVTARDPGERIVGGALETMFYEGPGRTTQHPGTSGGIAPDPASVHRVFATFTMPLDLMNPGEYWPGSGVARLQGNLTAAPSGTAKVGLGTGWYGGTQAAATLSPAADSPIAWVRWSASPTTTDTPGGPALVNGTVHPSTSAFDDDFASPALGGTPGTSYTVYVQWGTSGGRWSTPVAYPITVDSVAPVISNLRMRFAQGTVGHDAPIRLEWDQATDALSGVYRTAPAVRDTNSSSPSYTATLGPTATGYNARVWETGLTTASVTATDAASNTAYISRQFSMKPLQETSSTITYSSGWTTVKSTSYWRGGVRYATKAGAQAKFSFSGRAVGFVTTKGPKRGKAEIWVDGVLATTVDLYRSTTKTRLLVWEMSWPTSSAHVVRIKVLGTSGRPRVDLDGFVKF